MLTILRQSLGNWLEHRMPRHGAALAFFTLFALGPIVLATVVAAGRFLGEEYVRREAIDIVREFIGPAAAQTLEQIFVNWQPPALEWGSGLVALAALVFGATAFFVQLHDSLNIIWHAESDRSPVARTLYRRLLSFAMVLISGIVLLALFAVNAALATFHRLLSERFELPVGLFEYLHLGVSLVITALLLAALFRWVPDANVRWRDALIGGAATAVLFDAGKFLLGRYLRVAKLASAYGAAGSLVVTLIWIYYCSLLILLGAEFTYAYSQHRQRKRSR